MTSTFDTTNAITPKGLPKLFGPTTTANAATLPEHNCYHTLQHFYMHTTARPASCLLHHPIATQLLSRRLAALLLSVLLAMTLQSSAAFLAQTLCSEHSLAIRSLAAGF
jgi:hypothetical protein